MQRYPISTDKFSVDAMQELEKIHFYDEDSKMEYYNYNECVVELHDVSAILAIVPQKGSIQLNLDVPHVNLVN